MRIPNFVVAEAELDASDAKSQGKQHCCYYHRGANCGVGLTTIFYLYYGAFVQQRALTMEKTSFCVSAAVIVSLQASQGPQRAKSMPPFNTAHTELKAADAGDKHQSSIHINRVPVHGGKKSIFLNTSQPFICL